ncbi:hypothetical protein Q31b_23910 [Novipirellula aureliae]|uniref:Glycosyltransferase RgtA/B/C/D-like domain-containing protein n=1 Tax=Novipirellula aureliae TaxID=2527966 RepID=A0A5C6E356_9BACT|nr:hypothetical protein [Novipirellula aureliae]TWU43352.1 hypothetical protein Q31b_23910 [Novipirellula aureliae]
MTKSRKIDRLSLLIAVGLFLLSLTLRIPASSESLWVDELHTAWTISGSFPEVSPRAAAGNQQAFYFQALWLWGKIGGQDEVTLRATSAIAVSLSCSLLFLFVSRRESRKRQGGMLCGTAAGLLLAVDGHSIYFGTELRPYAIVILMATIACGCYASLWNQTSADRRGSATWVGLCLCIGTAAVCQITSLAVLGWLPLFLLAKWMYREGFRSFTLQPVDFAILVFFGLVGWSILSVGTSSAWQDRELWSRFASAHSLRQIWTIWPWKWVVVCPFTLWFIAFLVDRHGRRRRLGHSTEQEVRKLFYDSGSLTLSLLLVALLSTLLIWCVAYFEIVSLWHRRYLIATLPILCWCFGAALGTASYTWFRRHGPAQMAGGAISIIFIGMTMMDQGTASRLAKGYWPISRREDWRAAIAFVNERDAESNEVEVCLDPGLIEQHSIETPRLRVEQGEYLRYAIDGPYSLQGDTIWKVSVSGRRLSDAIESYEDPPAIVLSRRGKGRLQSILGATYSAHGFGNVSVGIRQSRNDFRDSGALE